ncbi:MAG: hypothetical protein AABY22_35400, partial [Nanoarchaeota archaeon]
ISVNPSFSLESFNPFFPTHWLKPIEGVFFFTKEEMKEHDRQELEKYKASISLDFTHEEDEDKGDDDDDIFEPCPTCGDIGGMVNPCCASYDPLHFKNIGYG